MRLALSPMVERLKAAGCRSVEGLLEFGSQTETPAALPAYFVVPTSDTARPNEVAGRRDQRVVAAISIMVVLEAARRHRGSIAEDLKSECGRVIDAVVGWTHPEATGPFDYAGGRLASADGRTVVWEVRVTAPYHLRKPS